LDYLDRSVKFKEQIEDLTNIPVLGFIPRLKGKDKETVALEAPSGYMGEAFNHIKTNLGLSILGRIMKICVITSAEEKEGKTLTALNMAFAFARANKRVLLMDCDMRKPKLKNVLADLLPDTGEHGLSSVLVGEVEFEDIVVSPKAVPNMDVALCGYIPPNPTELLDSPNFRKIIANAKKKYDMIIIDSPPALHVADSTILAGASIPVVFVTRLFKTNRKLLASTVEKIKNVQGISVGVIANNVEKKASKQSSYYYGGSYYKDDQ